MPVSYKKEIDMISFLMMEYSNRQRKNADEVLNDIFAVINEYSPSSLQKEHNKFMRGEEGFKTLEEVKNANEVKEPEIETDVDVPWMDDHTFDKMIQFVEEYHEAMDNCETLAHMEEMTYKQLDYLLKVLYPKPSKELFHVGVDKEKGVFVEPKEGIATFDYNFARDILDTIYDIMAEEESHNEEINGVTTD